MTSANPQQLRLTEYQSVAIAAAAMPTAVAQQLWQQFDRDRPIVQVTFPSPKTDNTWQLMSRGWVGHIPLTPTHHLYLEPRVPLQNLFAMWCAAYGLTNSHILPALVNVSSLPEFFDVLARILAQKVLHRARQGFYRHYETRTAALPFVRGRLQPQRQPAPPNQLLCRFDEQTAGLLHNQILAYTLQQIGRSQRCTPATQALVRQAFHTVHQIATAVPITAVDLQTLTYHRLNQDYTAMHALCRFFLEQIGPTHRTGDQPMTPFLIYMPRLFEQFVAAWLTANLPAPWQVISQETVQAGSQNELRFDIDLVLYDAAGQPTAVLDTKYKIGSKPTQGDINQIVTYAKVRRCQQAILIYPQPLAQPLNAHLDDIHLRSCTFDLSQPLAQAGQTLLDQILLTAPA